MVKISISNLIITFLLRFLANEIKKGGVFNERKRMFSKCRKDD